MSGFDDLEREHAAALADLTAVFDIAGGVDDVLRQLDRAQALNAVRDVLDLRSGAAAALDAAGFAGHSLRPDGDRTAPSTEAGPDQSRLTPELTDADSAESDQDNGVPGASPQNSASVESVLKQIRRISEWLDELRRVLATDHAYAPSLASVESCLDELAALLAGRAISRDAAADMVYEVRRLLRIVKEEIQDSGYAPRLNSVDHDVLRLRVFIDRLFDPSEHFEYIQSDL